MYRISELKVIDGDTIKCSIDLGFSVVLTNQTIRLHGIDTPESKTSDPIERVFGIAAKNRLSQLIKDEVSLLPVAEERDKFGRILGVLKIKDGRSINNILVAEKYAVLYSGKSKEQIKERHKKNREYLIENGIVKK